MTDDEIFEMLKHPFFEAERKDESFYSYKRVIGLMTSTICCYGVPIIKITMPETKEKVVEAIKGTYKIGAVKRFKSFIDMVRVPIPDSELFDLSREIRGLLASKY